ncbi:MAG: hypothetical protein Q4C86_05120 [bacterium]|nr:hypothetical protein [bacterium]
MNRLTELVLSFFDLLEAEGREFRGQAQAVLRGAMMLFFGGVLLTAGTLAAGYALYLALACLLGRPAAAFAVALLLCAAGMTLISKSSSPDKGRGDEARAEAENDK